MADTTELARSSEGNRDGATARHLKARCCAVGPWSESGRQNRQFRSSCGTGSRVEETVWDGLARAFFFSSLVPCSWQKRNGCDLQRRTGLGTGGEHRSVEGAKKSSSNGWWQGWPRTVVNCVRDMHHI